MPTLRARRSRVADPPGIEAFAQQVQEIHLAHRLLQRTDHPHADLPRTIFEGRDLVGRHLVRMRRLQSPHDRSLKVAQEDHANHRLRFAVQFADLPHERSRPVEGTESAGAFGVETARLVRSNASRSGSEERLPQPFGIRGGDIRGELAQGVFLRVEYPAVL